MDMLPPDVPYVNNVREVMEYDGNGNINLLTRSFQAVNANGDDYDGSNTLTYDYDNDGTNNLLRGVTFSTTSSGTNDFQPVPFLEHNYAYDYDGTSNLIKSTYGNEKAKYDWTPYGKVHKVERIGTASGQDVSVQTIRFGYGPDQNRWIKKRINSSGLGNSFTDYYVRDAQGNTLATYTRDDEAIDEDTGDPVPPNLANPIPLWLQPIGLGDARPTTKRR